MNVDLITGDVLDAAMKIHRALGPGLLESVYERLLAVELRKRGHVVECQKDVSFVYEGERFDNAFRLDMLVDSLVVVELKSTAQMLPVYSKQLRTYLVLMKLNVGLVVNFGLYALKDGVHRVVNNYIPLTSNPSSQSLCASASLRENDGGGAAKKASRRAAETRRGAK